MARATTRAFTNIKCMANEIVRTGGTRRGRIHRIMGKHTALPGLDGDAAKATEREKQNQDETGSTHFAGMFHNAAANVMGFWDA
jgi:hypothetical protein